MSLGISRYNSIYRKLARSDVAQNFPRHVFVREANNAGQFATGSKNLLVKQ